MTAEKPPVSATWTEKYRPKTLQDVAHQEEVVAMLNCALKGNDLPHLLFYGPPGTGKTSAALAFCRELFPKGTHKDRVLEMNASDDRGISAVRTKVADFSRRVAKGTEGGANVPAIKIIILDEVDAMTRDAQSAMRRVIEDCSKTTRFILICNYVSRLISPIVSRCAKFRFKPLPTDVQMNRLRTICSSEGVDIDDSDLSILIDKSEGDLRRAVGTLQSLAPLMKRDAATKDFYLKGTHDTDMVNEIIARIRLADVPLMVNMARTVVKSSSGVSFLRKLFGQLLEEDLISNDNIAVMGKLVASCEKRIMDGCDLERNLLDFLLTLHETLVN